MLLDRRHAHCAWTVRESLGDGLDFPLRTDGFLSQTKNGRMTFHFADYTIDPGRRELRLKDRPVHVEPQVFDLLLYLIKNRDRVVTKDELFATVWNGRIVSETTLSSRINAARRAIDDSGEKQSFIRTIPRRGFLFCGDLIRTESSEPTAPAMPPASQDRRPAKEQKVTFCKAPGGVNLAVAMVGEGPTLVKTANWLNHLEYDWQSPIFQPLFQRLCRERRLVRYDARGTGLSDREAQDISFDAFLLDLETVVDALGLERFSLLGISQGVAVAAAYAARHPERVDKLVLHGGYAQGRRRRSSAADEEQAEAFTILMRHGWGDEHSAFMQAFSSIYVPRGTPEQIRWFTDLQRISTSAETAVRIRKACDQIDVVDLLPKVRAPTLVTHSRHDHVVPFEQGRLLATSIPGACLVALDSDNHPILPDEPAWAKWLSEIEAFLAS
jgi:DNA-binding winged helix-turn-helix (wHTH) protein/pimeloyl-ACP methyl ester carboxylesterase